MMGKIWDWIKSHPYLTAAGIFGVGLILVFVVFRKPSSAAAPDNAYAVMEASRVAAIQSGNQLAGQQLQQQVATSAVNADAAIRAGETAATVEIARLAANSKDNEFQLTRQMAEISERMSIGLAQIGASRDTSISTINAQAMANTNSWNAQQNQFNTLAASNVHVTDSSFDFLSRVGAAQLADSPPFAKQTGGTNFAYDPNGRLSSVAYEIEATEFLEPSDIQQLNMLYNAYLGREPDPAGLAYYRAELASGVPLSNISQSILSSDEYKNRSIH